MPVPPPDQADPPWTRDPPPWDQADPHPPDQADTPLDQADPPGPETHPGPGRPTPDQADTPRTRQTPPQEADASIWSMSGRYASYWNAFLFKKVFPNICLLNTIIRFFNKGHLQLLVFCVCLWYFEYVNLKIRHHIHRPDHEHFQKGLPLDRAFVLHWQARKQPLSWPQSHSWCDQVQLFNCRLISHHNLQVTAMRWISIVTQKFLLVIKS